MPSITIPLVNGTKLGSGYSIYVMGFSSTSQKYLQVTAGTTTAKFVKPTDAAGNLPAAKLGSGVTEITVDTTAATAKTAADPVDGGRIYFFVANDSDFPTAPVVSYTNYCKQVTNVTNPPNTDVPPYTFAEFTFVNPSYGAVIDSQTVDGFVFPVTIEVDDSTGTSLGKVGQPLTMIRSSVTDAFAPFLTALGSEGTPFSNLAYTANQGGLLNPGAFLNDTDSKNQFSNLSSSLNTLFDADLDTFFKLNTLSVQGVSSGSITTDTYTGAAGSVALPNSTFSQQALTFTGDTNGKSFTVYSPVGLCTCTSVSSGVHSAIIGTINTLTLTFETALPAGTSIQKGMYVQGAGIPAGTIKVGSVNTGTGGVITSLGLELDLGNPAAATNYQFSATQGAYTGPSFSGQIDKTTLTFSGTLPTSADIKKGDYVQGAGVVGVITVGSITTNKAGDITSIVLATDLMQPAPKSQYLFSKVNDIFLTSGNQVFGNFGLFAYTGGVSDADEQTVLKALQNQIVTAFNRGVALSGPTSGTKGYSTEYWGTQTNWYPVGKPQNIFSLFMHTATTNDTAKTPLFIQATGSTTCSRGTTMGQSYGFAYDENAGPVPPAPTGQPEVPSKFDPLPSGAATVTITLGPWLEDV